MYPLHNTLAIRAGHQPSCPGYRVPAREWVTLWRWSLACHQGLRVLLVMTGQGKACMMTVSPHTQDPLKRPVIHSTFYFGGVWFAEFRVELVQVAQGLIPADLTTELNHTSWKCWSVQYHINMNKASTGISFDKGSVYPDHKEHFPCCHADTMGLSSIPFMFLKI